MKLRLFNFLLICLAFGFLLQSCTNESQIQSTSNDKLEVDKSKLFSDINVFKNYWIGRLSKVKTQNDEINKSILVITQELSRLEEFKISPDIINSAIIIANLADGESFIRIFSSHDTNLELKLSENVCKICIEDLKSGIYFQTLKSENLELRADPEKCSCRWACVGGTSLGAPGSCTVPVCASGQTKYCCMETSTGCGFLYLGSCTGHDTLDCP